MAEKKFHALALVPLKTTDRGATTVDPTRPTLLLMQPQQPTPQASTKSYFFPRPCPN